MSRQIVPFLTPATAKFRVPRLVFVPVTARQPHTADRRCRRLAIDDTVRTTLELRLATLITVLGLHKQKTVDTNNK